MPRGRKKKVNKSTTEKKIIANIDLFNTVTEILGRDLTEDETLKIIEGAKSFIKENLTPLQVFDADVLKEEVLVNGLVKESGTDDDNDNDDDSDYFGWGRGGRRGGVGSGLDFGDDNNDNW